MDKSELLKKALNKDQPVDLNIGSVLNKPVVGDLSRVDGEKFNSKNSFLDDKKGINKNTFIDQKGKNKQVLKNLKNSKKH
jgi:hypothetical protein